MLKFLRYPISCVYRVLTATSWRRVWGSGWRDLGESDSVRANERVRGLERRSPLELKGLREVTKGIQRGFWRKRKEREGRGVLRGWRIRSEVEAGSIFQVLRPRDNVPEGNWDFGSFGSWGFFSFFVLFFLNENMGWAYLWAPWWRSLDKVQFQPTIQCFPLQRVIFLYLCYTIILGFIWFGKYTGGQTTWNNKKTS